MRSSGPERLGAEWWLTHQKLMLTEETAQHAAAAKPQLEQYYKEGQAARDYFIAEDDAGRRFWIFREGLYETKSSPHWFLHGFFA
jgi:protein ImuB